MYSVLPTIISGFTYQQVLIFVRKGDGGIGNSDRQVYRCNKGFSGIWKQFDTFAFTIVTKIMILVVGPEVNMTQIKRVLRYSYKNHFTFDTNDKSVFSSSRLRVNVIGRCRPLYRIISSWSYRESQH